MRGKHVSWSSTELAWVEKNRTLPRKEAHAAFCKKFKRTDISITAYNALCKRKGWKTGRNGRYQPGDVAYNKGKKMPYNENSAKTQFKKGRVPHNTKYLKHERVSKEGYTEISIDEENPHTGYGRRYVLKHRYLWQLKNGDVPEGMCLKNIDGNRLNTDPSNWELIPRAILPLLNGGYAARGINYEEAEPEVKPVVLSLAKLRHAQAVKIKEKEEE